MAGNPHDWERLIDEAESAQARAQAAIHDLRRTAPRLARQRDGALSMEAGAATGLADGLVRIGTSIGTDAVLESLCTALRRITGECRGAVLLQNDEGDLPAVVAVWQRDQQWVDGVQGLHRHLEDRRPASLLEELQNCAADQSLSLPLESLGLELGEVRIWASDGRLEPLSEDCRSVVQVAALALAGLRLRVKARSRAMRDPLTGLFNRRYLVDTLPREFHRCRRNSNPLGLISVDLDGFTRFNQVHGTVNGDRLLQAVGGLLQSSFRGSDICCRTEGGQFLVVMPEADLEDTRRRAEALLPDIRGLTIASRRRIPEAPSASVGIAAFPQQAQQPDELLAAADSARLLARQSGGNQVRIAERIER